MKRIVAFGLTALLALSFISCSLQEPAPPDTTGTPAGTVAPVNTPAPTPKPDFPLAHVNSFAINRSDFDPVFNNVANSYMQMGLDMTQQQNLQDLQDEVLNYLVDNQVLLQQATERNIALSDAELSANQLEISRAYESDIAYFEQAAQSEGLADDAAKARALELYEQAVQGIGFTMEEYRERSLLELNQSDILTKLQESVYAEVTLSEEEALAEYQLDLAADKESFSAEPALYESAYSNAQSGSGIPPLFVPEGYSRVKHILINTKEEGAEKSALDVANELVVRLKNGEDFDALMEEFGEDPGMQAEPNKTDGYLLSTGTAFVESFKTAALALENVGDITEPVQSDYGYHIIKLVSRVESREIPFEEVKDTYISRKLLALQQEHFTAMRDQWKAAAVIETDTEALRGLLEQ